MILQKTLKKDVSISWVILLPSSTLSLPVSLSLPRGFFLYSLEKTVYSSYTYINICIYVYAHNPFLPLNISSSESQPIFKFLSSDQHWSPILRTPNSKKTHKYVPIHTYICIYRLTLFVSGLGSAKQWWWGWWGGVHGPRYHRRNSKQNWSFIASKAYVDHQKSH